jgi:hypothetical protein
VINMENLGGFRQRKRRQIGAHVECYKNLWLVFESTSFSVFHLDSSTLCGDIEFFRGGGGGVECGAEGEHLAAECANQGAEDCWQRVSSAECVARRLRRGSN